MTNGYTLAVLMALAVGTSQAQTESFNYKKALSGNRTLSASINTINRTSCSVEKESQKRITVAYLRLLARLIPTHFPE